MVDQNSAVTPDKLKTAAEYAFREWSGLYREPDSMTNPSKRMRMLRARQAYQDALTKYLFVLRTKEQLDNK